MLLVLFNTFSYDLHYRLLFDIPTAALPKWGTENNYPRPVRADVIGGVTLRGSGGSVQERPGGRWSHDRDSGKQEAARRGGVAAFGVGVTRTKLVRAGMVRRGVGLPMRQGQSGQGDEHTGRGGGARKGFHVRVSRLPRLAGNRANRGGVGHRALVWFARAGTTSEGHRDEEHADPIMAGHGFRLQRGAECAGRFGRLMHRLFDEPPGRGNPCRRFLTGCDRL